MFRQAGHAGRPQLSTPIDVVYTGVLPPISCCAVKIPPFRPAWWLPGGHAQTLGARLLRSRRGVRLTPERVELPDGDFVDLAWPSVAPPDSQTAPLVLVLHGLEGSARSTYAVEMYRALGARGLASVGLSFRSCSGELNRLPRLYHSGETGDLAYVLDLLAARFPGRRIGAAGFSLGGNVLLKYLGDDGRRQATAAAVISVPFDLSAGADRLDRGFSRLYRWYLLRKLKRKTRAKARILEAQVDVRQALAARTFRQFDDVATAPLHGFADAEDYYRRSSSGRYLRGISIPTLLIHSADDPFLPRGAIPGEAVRARGNLVAAFTERGGHVGFVSGSPWAPVFWAERTAAAFLAEHLALD